MHIVLVSNCVKKARQKTVQLLDRYATRIGDATWKTTITDEALAALHKALRKIATRQTSVACYKNHATHGMALHWLVGNTNDYDAEGNFAIGTSIKKRPYPLILRQASLMAKFSGYVHDFGKANQQFQNKLEESCKGNLLTQKDAIRHEWLSALLVNRCSFEALDAEQLTTLWTTVQGLNIKELKNPQFLENPATNALGACLWAVATHHGAMGGSFTVANGVDSSRHIDLKGPWSTNQTLAKSFAVKGAKLDEKRWDELFQSIQQVYARMSVVERSHEFWHTTMLIARAALILADHKVSSQTFKGSRDPNILFANTKTTEIKKLVHKRSSKKIPERFLDQPLSWHLQQVGHHAPDYVRMFDDTQMPVVSPALVDLVVSKQATPGSRFYWQDKSVMCVSELSGPKLVFNVASTGAGKTLANLKMAFAMRKNNARVVAAFNLRSLTTQTFSAFGTHLQMENQTLFQQNFACLLGESSQKAPYFAKEDGEKDDESISVEPELQACTTQPPAWLNRIAGVNAEQSNLIKLVAAPVLVSTMDWIVAAGEPGQQARHVKALLRVATSDLILDEVDSYDVSATVAVMRVVQIAASFGRNVIVSSATLSPALVNGLAAAYAIGYRQYKAVQDNSSNWHSVIVQDNQGIEPVVLTAPEVAEVDACYRSTMQNVAIQNAYKLPTKRFQVVAIEPNAFLHNVHDKAMDLHNTWKNTPLGLNCQLSIGLVRVANISTCVKISEHLRSSGHFVVSAYHARDLVNRRKYKEMCLDKILSRGTDAWVEELKTIYPAISNCTGDIRLVVVATPVEEVGRDHDFDWAIVEPSSMHSIIQTAGRVNRHRRIAIAAGRYNIAILDVNWREYEQGQRASATFRPCFIAPGLEMVTPSGTTHPQHEMSELLRNRAGTYDDILDAGLIFDQQRKTKMAQYDEDAVALQCQKALPVLAKNEGFAMAYMLKDFVVTYPLRENNHSYQFELRAGKELYNCFDKLQVGAWKETVSPSNTWLTSALEEPERLQISSAKELQISDILVTWNNIEF